MAVWLAVTVCLIISVIYMEIAITKAGIGVANRKLVILHIINFSLWLTTYSIERFLYFRKLIVGNQYDKAVEAHDDYSLWDEYDKI